MKTLEITRLELVGFGKFRERTIDLTSGLNLIEGPNEAGKSTIQSFITGMFYGFFQPGTKRRSYTPHRDKYRPWDQGSYRGVLVCKNEERSWRIERCFDKDNETVNVYDDQTGDDLTLDFPYNPVTRQPQVGEKLLGLSKTAFNNTANIAQMTCASVSREADFSAEVNDKLLSVMKTADASLSLSAVIHELDSRIEQIGSPKKSKTPYGQACQLKKELEEELEESGKNQKDYQQLCTQIDRLAEQTAQLQKEKELLETQIRQSAAKELGGRYLKAQNLRTRIERIEKEYEKYAIYQSVDLREIDQTQKRMAAKAQINRTMEKYRRASQEVEHRIQELNTLYRTLEVSEASEEVLEQFESVYERYLTLGQMGQEIKEMMIRQRNIAFHRSRLNPMDEAKLREDIQTWRQLQQQKQEKENASHKVPMPAIVLLVLGVLLILGGGLCAILKEELLAVGIGCATVGVLLVLSGGVFWMLRRKNTAAHALEKIESMQQDILRAYQLSDEEQAKTAATALDTEQAVLQLEEMLGRIQVNNYKIEQFEQQEQQIGQEIAAKQSVADNLREQICRYLTQLTGREIPPEELAADKVPFKSLRESVNQARRLRTEMQRLTLQQQQTQQEEENCRMQIEQINRSIQQVVAACEAAGAKDAEDLERCKQGKRRWDEISMELKMQKELLAQTLGRYSFEEIEENIKNQRAVGEGDISADRQQIHQQLQGVNEQLAELARQTAELEGLRKGREESHRPIGQIQAQIADVEESCQNFQFELDALQLAKQKLLSLSGQLHRDFAPQLNARISKALERITGSRYTRAVIDQTLGIRLEDRQTHQLVEVSALSNGMADLVYLVMRLELLELLCSQGGERVQVPIILDDSFTQLDDERTARLLGYLLEQPSVQILLFSCHRRERAMLEQAKIPYHLVSL
ncbi:MAG: AAA family ATPase [Clostridium sp.]|nr:AAA family ATPase [Clostridium sp.]